MVVESSSRGRGFRARFVKVLGLKQTHVGDDPKPISALEAHRDKYNHSGIIDTQLGERRDDTAMLHSLVHHDSFSSLRDPDLEVLDCRPSGEDIIARIPREIWEIITDYLTPCDAANLAFSSKTLLGLVGHNPWTALSSPSNRESRLAFLLPMGATLPDHLLCFICLTYHYRIQIGQESLKSPRIVNLLFSCPNSSIPPPRLRLTPTRNLPFTFAQLALRAFNYTPAHGIPVASLSRRWTQEHWSHQSLYHIQPSNGHLLLRITSYAFAAANLPPAAQRQLLFSKEDYTPYFSACAHWRDGKLMALVKCALSHIPTPPDTAGPRGMAHNIHERMGGRSISSNALVTLCADCRPMRRCPECATEYLIEVRLMEDKKDAVQRFKQAIVVTRWSDLGTCIDPAEGEWAACTGALKGYDSFAKVGRRAVSGIFEASYTEDHIPGNRILSLNPKGKKLGENGDSWY